MMGMTMTSVTHNRYILQTAIDLPVNAPLRI